MNSEFNQSSSTTEEAEDGGGPIVFQCARCGSIVSDSLVFLSENKEMNTLSVSGVSETVEVLDSVEVAKEGPDEGSTYQLVACRGANSHHVIGRKYIATSPKLDYLRNVFTLDINMLTSYEVGKQLHYATSEKSTPAHRTNEYLFAQLCKMQSLLVALHNRVGEVEKKLAQTLTTHKNDNNNDIVDDISDDCDDDVCADSNWSRNEAPSEEKQNNISSTRTTSKYSASSTAQKRKASHSSGSDSSKKYRH